MKPIELYHTWSQFDAMIANPTLSDEKKLAIGGEWIRSLPPKLLCVSSQLSYDIVYEAMNGRLNDLKEKLNGSARQAKEGTEEEAGQKPAQSPKRSSKKSVQKDAGDA